MGRHPQPVERLVGRDAVALHENSLGLTDHVAGYQGLLEALYLRRQPVKGCILSALKVLQGTDLDLVLHCRLLEPAP